MIILIGFPLSFCLRCKIRHEGQVLQRHGQFVRQVEIISQDSSFIYNLDGEELSEADPCGAQSELQIPATQSQVELFEYRMKAGVLLSLIESRSYIRI